VLTRSDEAEHIKVEHIWAVVFFTVGLLMLTYFALSFWRGEPLCAAGAHKAPRGGQISAAWDLRPAPTPSRAILA
jgi:hypothetical protein